MPSNSRESTTTLVGFGLNYNYNFGAATETTLKHSDEESIKCFTVEDTPWEKDDDDLIEIATTASSSVFLTKSGKVYSCGTIHGKIAPNLRQTVIQLPLKCVEIATGRHFALARMEGGLAVCSWGAGHFGQLALGGHSAPFMDHPTVIESLLPHVVGAPVASISAGHWHAMAVTQSGSVYSWGCNRNAQCGFKPQKDPPTLCNPQQVRFDATNPTPKIVKTALGKSHSVALDDRGKVYCWGGCQYGQCGILVRRRGGVTSPKQVEALNEVKITDIAAGDTHTLAMTGGGRVFSFGSGFEGQLGAPAIVQMNPKPKLVMELDFVAIQAGKEWKLQQKESEDSDNEDANEGSEFQPSPKLTKHDATSLSKVPRISSIHAAGNCSIALSSIGQLYVWGCNDVENLGIPKPSGHIPFAEPGYSEVEPSRMRPYHTQSFDSSHNIGLPQRVDSLLDTNISIIAASPTFMWCAGSKRPSKTTRTEGSVEKNNGTGPSLSRKSSNDQSSKDGSASSDTKSQRRSLSKSSDPQRQDPPEVRDGSLGASGAGFNDSYHADIIPLPSGAPTSRNKQNSSFPPKSPGPAKTKRRFSIPKVIGKLVRRASLGGSVRSDTEEKDGERKGRKI